MINTLIEKSLFYHLNINLFFFLQKLNNYSISLLQDENIIPSSSSSVNSFLSCLTEKLKLVSLSESLFWISIISITNLTLGLSVFFFSRFLCKVFLAKKLGLETLTIPLLEIQFLCILSSFLKFTLWIKTVFCLFNFFFIILSFFLFLY